MAEDNNELEMGLFDSPDLELNIDYNPEEEEEQEEVEDQQEDNKNTDTGDNTNDNSSEDQETDSEEVAGDDEDESEGDDDTSPNLYSSLASVLHEQGLLPSLDLQNGKIDSVDDISAAFRAEIDSNVKNKLVETLGEDGYEAVTNGIPLSELAKSKEAQVTLGSITEDALSEDPELSKRIIYQDYVNQGMPEDKAKRLLRRIIDSGEDAVLEDARESLDSLKAFETKQLESRQEAYKEQLAAQEKEREDLDQKVKDKIYNSEELVKGLKLNKAIQDRVYKSMTDIVGKNQDGVLENKLMRDRRDNPIEFDTKLYYLYELTSGFKDFSKVINTTKSSAIGDLEKSLRQTRHQDTSTPGYLQDDESYSGLGDELVL